MGSQDGTQHKGYCWSGHTGTQHNTACKTYDLKVGDRFWCASHRLTWNFTSTTRPRPWVCLKLIESSGFQTQSARSFDPRKQVGFFANSLRYGRLHRTGHQHLEEVRLHFSIRFGRAHSESLDESSASKSIAKYELETAQTCHCTSAQHFL